MATGIGDIELNGKLYRIDLPTWRERDIIDFAPRATVPGGSVVMSDLNLYQPMVQTDFTHGQGFNWYEDASGYMKTIGNIDTRQDGLAMLYTKSVAKDFGAGTLQGLTVFNGVLYGWSLDDGVTTGKLRKYTAGAWSDVYAGAVRAVLAAGDYLFFAPVGSRIQKMNTSGTITNAGLDTNAKDYAWFIIHGGAIYAGKYGTNQVYFDTNPDLSQLEGTTADPNIIYCGVSNIPTKGAIVYAGNLYVSRYDGLWTIGADHIAQRVIDYSGEATSTNFAGMAILNGYLIFSIRDRVIQWNGARVSDISPQKINDIFPYVMYGKFGGFVSTQNFLYLAAYTNESPSTVDLLCYNGIGWHRLLTIGTSSTMSVPALAYDVANNYIWFHSYDTNGTVEHTYYVPLQSQSSFPYAAFPTTGQNSLITSRLDAGFRRVRKSMASLILGARNCSTTSYISVYYQIDSDGNWIKWADIKQSGFIELKNPASFRTREFNWLMLRFDFVTNDATQSPILEDYTLRFIMRPNTLLGFNFWIIGASRYQSGTAEDGRLASEIRDDILTIRNSKAPVKLVGIEGDEHWGYITTFTGMPMYRVEHEEEIPDEIEWRFQVNFVEVG